MEHFRLDRELAYLFVLSPLTSVGIGALRNEKVQNMPQLL